MIKKYKQFISESTDFSSEDEQILEDTFIRLVDLKNLHITFNLKSNSNYIFYTKTIIPDFSMKTNLVFSLYKQDIIYPATDVFIYFNEEILIKLIKKYLNLKNIKLG